MQATAGELERLQAQNAQLTAALQEAESSLEESRAETEEVKMTLESTKITLESEVRAVARIKWVSPFMIFRLLKLTLRPNLLLPSKTARGGAADGLLRRRGSTRGGRAALQACRY